ncbi:hypothetical protein [Cupriavidus sp. DL-D2]|uniref:hypothetical protein n=1 Tax=Cupriavidus sp. DL-D2 TaxID=3144974 RepID=UPI00321536C0
MKTTLLDAIEQIIAADRSATKEVAKSGAAVIRAMRERKAAFTSEEEKVKEKLERGARITKHRIPL